MLHLADTHLDWWLLLEKSLSMSKVTLHRSKLCANGTALHCEGRVATWKPSSFRTTVWRRAFDTFEKALANASIPSRKYHPAYDGIAVPLEAIRAAQAFFDKENHQ